MLGQLQSEIPDYRHVAIDIRDREAVLALMEELKPDLIIHTAAQPSHDRAAAIPFLDFEVNALGTLHLLEAARRSCPESPFIHMSTNKVYGDRPNSLPLAELETRWEYADPAFENGIAEDFSIDQSKHSIFGASKVAADIMVQEYGRYFGMPTCCLRGGCLTGPNHSGVELHGFLSYLVKCSVEGREYKVFGYKGKQVRDNIHSEDVASFMYEFSKSPRVAEVYNLGGGKSNSCSILEAFRMAEDVTGKKMNWRYVDENRIGDHICYYSDLRKMKAHYPDWKIVKTLPMIFEEIAASWKQRLAARCLMRILITGVCGFVGSTLAECLLERVEGIRVAGIDNLMRPGAETNRARIERLGVEFIHGDLRSASDIAGLPACEWVIDAAANPSVLAGLSGAGSSRRLFEHNLAAIGNVLEYCREHKAGLLLLSSSRVYSIPALAAIPLRVQDQAFALDRAALLPRGLTMNGVGVDFSTAAPVSLYGAAKLASEIMALEYGAAFDFPVWITRCGVLAGAGQFGTPAQGIFAFWVNAHLRRRPLRYIGFNGAGYQARDAFHPRDLAALMVSANAHGPLRWTTRLYRRRRPRQHDVARAAHRLVRRTLRAPCSGRRSGTTHV